MERAIAICLTFMMIPLLLFHVDEMERRAAHDTRCAPGLGHRIQGGAEIIDPHDRSSCLPPERFSFNPETQVLGFEATFYQN
jgi:hypothetical protein